MPVHLGFNAGEDLVPEVHFLSKKPFVRASPRRFRLFIAVHGLRSLERRIQSRICGFAPVRTPEKSQGTRPRSTVPVDFPQIFPQVWKTLVRDQTRMGSAGPAGTQFDEDADCNTTSRSIDTAGTPSLTLTIRSIGTPSRGARAFPRGLIRLPEQPDEGQANLPAEHASAQANPWVSRADEHEKRPAGPEAPASQGTQASLRE